MNYYIRPLKGKRYTFSDLLFIHKKYKQIRNIV